MGGEVLERQILCGSILSTLADTWAPLPGRVFGHLEVYARKTSEVAPGDAVMGDRQHSSSSRDSAYQVPVSALEAKAALPTASLKSGVPHKGHSALVQTLPLIHRDSNQLLQVQQHTFN